jgi:predicted nucleotide-binding protein (sugar kinase/HSP70/actin superfamily)
MIRLVMSWQISLEVSGLPMFRPDVDAGHIKSPFDIADVWPSSYSANTNEILWAAKFAARMPWIACVVRLSSYECGMDQPTYSPVQQIVERSGTLFSLSKTSIPPSLQGR